jgi:DNA-directed RNA polymerase specialized sigma24 family protein
MSRRNLFPHAAEATDEVVRQAWVRLCRHLRSRGTVDPSGAPSERELVDGDVSGRGREAASVEIVLEAWDLVTRALDSLTDREIAVFVRRLEGDTPAAIAEALNISRGQVDDDLEKVVAVLGRPQSI